MSRLALPLACCLPGSLCGLILWLGLVYDRSTPHCVARALFVVYVQALPAANVHLAREARPAPVALLPATLRLPCGAAYAADLSAVCGRAELVLRFTAAVLLLDLLQLLHHHLVLRIQCAHDRRAAVLLLAVCLLTVRRFLLSLLLGSGARRRRPRSASCPSAPAKNRPRAPQQAPTENGSSPPTWHPAHTESLVAEFSRPGGPRAMVRGSRPLTAQPSGHRLPSRTWHEQQPVCVRQGKSGLSERAYSRPLMVCPSLEPLTREGSISNGYSVTV